MRDYKFKGKDGKWCIIRCEKCHKENYAPMVSSGKCAWCGYDANEKEMV